MGLATDLTKVAESIRESDRFIFTIGTTSANQLDKFIDDMATLGNALGFDGDGDGWTYPRGLEDKPPTMIVNSSKLRWSPGFHKIESDYHLKEKK